MEVDFSNFGSELVRYFIPPLRSYLLSSRTVRLNYNAKIKEMFILLSTAYSHISKV